MNRSLEIIEEADTLLDELPNVREAFIRVSSQGLQGWPIPDRDAAIIRQFLEKTDRSADDVALFDYVIEHARGSDQVDARDFAEVLDAIEQATLDLHGLLVDRIAGGEIEDDEYRDLERQFRAYLAHPPEGARDERLQVVKEFIYDNPGHYVKKIHRRLRERAEFPWTYETLLNDIHELQAQDEILTVEEAKGHPRFCFPNPDRVENRGRYFGERYPVSGEIEEELSSSFSLEKALAEVYLVRQSQPLLLVLPIGTGLANHDRVEGFGTIQSLEYLSTWMPVRRNRTVSVDDVVLGQLVKRNGEKQEILEIPPDFRAAFTR